MEKIKKFIEWGAYKKRLVSSLFLIFFSVITVFFMSISIFIFSSFVISMICMWEWGRLSGLRSSFLQMIWMIFSFFIFLFLTYIILPTEIAYEQRYSLLQIQIFYKILEYSLFGWILSLLLILSYPIFFKLLYSLRITRLIFGLLIISSFYLGSILIKYFRIERNFQNSWKLFYNIILVCSMDISSYFFGKKFGHFKLASKISPKKTWEGLIGGILVTILIIFFFNKKHMFNIKQFKFLFCSIIISFMSVIGDLTESMFKREIKIKDSGKLIPGHGGVLDRLDGLIASIPIFAFLDFFAF